MSGSRNDIAGHIAAALILVADDDGQDLPSPEFVARQTAAYVSALTSRMDAAGDPHAMRQLQFISSVVEAVAAHRMRRQTGKLVASAKFVEEIEGIVDRHQEPHAVHDEAAEEAAWSKTSAASLSGDPVVRAALDNQRVPGARLPPGFVSKAKADATDPRFLIANSWGPEWGAKESSIDPSPSDAACGDTKPG